MNGELYNRVHACLSKLFQLLPILQLHACLYTAYLKCQGERGRKFNCKKKELGLELYSDSQVLIFTTLYHLLIVLTMLTCDSVVCPRCTSYSTIKLPHSIWSEHWVSYHSNATILRPNIYSHGQVLIFITIYHLLIVLTMLTCDLLFVTGALPTPL